MMEKNWGWIQEEGRREPKGATHTVLFSHSRKLAHSRGGIVLYRWNYFARKKTGSSMICVPRSCCAELFPGPQRCQERWGWRCWWKASQACQNISWKLINGFWDPEKCRWQIPIRTLLTHFWKAQHYWLWHFQKLLKVRIVFGEEHVQSTTYVPEEKEYVANCMKYKFHLKGVFAIPWKFPAILAWNMLGPGIWARNCVGKLPHWFFGAYPNRHNIWYAQNVFDQEVAAAWQGPEILCASGDSAPNYCQFHGKMVTTMRFWQTFLVCACLACSFMFTAQFHRVCVPSGHLKPRADSLVVKSALF